MPALRKALEAKPDLEARQRVEKLLERLQGTTEIPEKLRLIRAVEALEIIATAEARELLQRLAKGQEQVLDWEQAKADLRKSPK